MSSRSNFGTSGEDAYNSMKRGHYHAPALVKVPEPDSEGYICSLSPAATEMVYALGLEHRLVGITSDCDYPKGVQRAHSVMTSSRSINETGNGKSNFLGGDSSNKSTHSSSGYGSSHRGDASGHSGPNNMEININMLRSSNARRSFLLLTFVNHAWTNLLIPEVRLGQFAKLVRGENTFKIPRTRTTPNSWDIEQTSRKITT